MRAAGARITVVRTMMITAVVEGNLDGLARPPELPRDVSLH
jgi:hypothetical protein